MVAAQDLPGKLALLPVDKNGPLCACGNHSLSKRLQVDIPMASQAKKLVAFRQTDLALGKKS